MALFDYTASSIQVMELASLGTVYFCRPYIAPDSRHNGACVKILLLLTSMSDGVMKANLLSSIWAVDEGGCVVRSLTSSNT